MISLPRTSMSKLYLALVFTRVTEVRGYAEQCVLSRFTRGQSPNRRVPGLASPSEYLEQGKGRDAIQTTEN